MVEIVQTILYNIYEYKLTYLGYDKGGWDQSNLLAILAFDEVSIKLNAIENTITVALLVRMPLNIDQLLQQSNSGAI